LELYPKLPPEYNRHPVRKFLFRSYAGDASGAAMLRGHAFVGVIVGLFVFSGPSYSANLNTFLANLDQNCRGTDAFEAFRASLVRRYAYPKDPQQEIAIPGELRSLMGRIRVRHIPNPGGYFHVFVPLKGRFRELDVVAVEFVFGDSNGINSAAIVFADSFKNVNKTLGKGVEVANKRIQEEYAKAVEDGSGGADPETLAVELIKGRVKLTCDMSN
jgi:hypothetical protein